MIVLFASSPHLAQAGLEWQAFYRLMETNIETAGYSQHATTFLLTLLPSVERISLPKEWISMDATEHLLDVIAREAKKSHLPHDEPSLARVRECRLKSRQRLWRHRNYDSHWARSFLALPRVQGFRGPGCIARVRTVHTYMPSSKVAGSFAITTIHLLHMCRIDQRGFAEFLKASPSLKWLRYSYAGERTRKPKWDLCKFVKILEREVGDRLEGFSIAILGSDDLIIPGRVLLSGFQRLQKLELPTELVICNMTASAIDGMVTAPDESSTTGKRLADYRVPIEKEHLIENLVPTSVSQLSLLSKRADKHAQALEVFFRDFDLRKKTTLYALENIFLTCPCCEEGTYKDLCTRLRKKIQKAGVTVSYMVPCEYSAAVLDWKELEFAFQLIPCPHVSRHEELAWGGTR